MAQNLQIDPEGGANSAHLGSVCRLSISITRHPGDTYINDPVLAGLLLVNVNPIQHWTRPETRTLLILIICSGLLLLFVELTENVMLGGTASVDQTLLLVMREAGDIDDPLGPGWFEETARDFTALGGIPILLTLTLVTASYLLMHDRPRSATFLVVTAVTSVAVSTALKEVFDRPRPDLVDQGTRVYTSSFPSAHAMLSAAMYLAFATLLAQAEVRRRNKVSILLFAAMLIAVVGLSRIYLGVHWPTDVLAGWTAGSAWTLMCWLVYHHLNRRRRRRLKSA